MAISPAIAPRRPSKDGFPRIQLTIIQATAPVEVAVTELRNFFKEIFICLTPGANPGWRELIKRGIRWDATLHIAILLIVYISAS